jgi:hypothetical protein
MYNQTLEATLLALIELSDVDGGSRALLSHWLV